MKLRLPKALMTAMAAVAVAAAPFATTVATGTFVAVAMTATQAQAELVYGWDADASAPTVTDTATGVTTVITYGYISTGAHGRGEINAGGLPSGAPADANAIINYTDGGPYMGAAINWQGRNIKFTAGTWSKPSGSYTADNHSRVLEEGSTFAAKNGNQIEANGSITANSIWLSSGRYRLNDDHIAKVGNIYAVGGQFYILSGTINGKVFLGHSDYTEGNANAGAALRMEGGTLNDVTLVENSKVSVYSDRQTGVINSLNIGNYTLTKVGDGTLKVNTLTGTGDINVSGALVFNAANHSRIENAITLESGATLGVTDTDSGTYHNAIFSNLKVKGNATLVAGHGGQYGSGMFVGGLDLSQAAAGTTLTLKDDHNAANYASVVAFSSGITSTLNGTLAIIQERGGDNREFLVWLDNENLLSGAEVNFSKVGSSNGFAVLAVKADNVNIKGLSGGATTGPAAVISYTGAYNANVHTDSTALPTSDGGHTVTITAGEGESYTFSGTVGDSLKFIMDGAGTQSIKALGANGEVLAKQGNFIITESYAGASNKLTTQGSGKISFGNNAVIALDNLTVASSSTSGVTEDGFLQSGYTLTGAGNNIHFDNANAVKVSLGGAQETASYAGGVLSVDGSVYRLVTTDGKSYAEIVTAAGAKTVTGINIAQDSKLTGYNDGTTGLAAPITGNGEVHIGGGTLTYNTTAFNNLSGFRGTLVVDNGGNLSSQGRGANKTGFTRNAIKVLGGGILTTTATDELGWDPFDADNWSGAVPSITLKGDSEEVKAVWNLKGRQTLRTNIILEGHTVINAVGNSGTDKKTWAGLNPFGGSITVSGTDNVNKAMLQTRDALTIDVAADGEFRQEGEIWFHEDPGTITKTGDGTFTIASAPSSNKALSLEGGKLKFAGAAGSYAGAVTAAEGTEVIIAHEQPAGQTGDFAPSIATNFTMADGTTLTSSGVNETLTGTISGNADLEVTAGALTLSGSSVAFDSISIASDASLTTSASTALYIDSTIDNKGALSLGGDIYVYNVTHLDGGDATYTEGENGFLENVYKLYANTADATVTNKTIHLAGSDVTYQLTDNGTFEVDTSASGRYYVNTEVTHNAESGATGDAVRTLVLNSDSTLTLEQNLKTYTEDGTTSTVNIELIGSGSTVSVGADATLHNGDISSAAGLGTTLAGTGTYDMDSNGSTAISSAVTLGENWAGAVLLTGNNTGTLAISDFVNAAHTSAVKFVPAGEATTVTLGTVNSDGAVIKDTQGLVIGFLNFNSNELKLDNSSVTVQGVAGVNNGNPVFDMRGQNDKTGWLKLVNGSTMTVNPGLWMRDNSQILVEDTSKFIQGGFELTKTAGATFAKVQTTDTQAIRGLCNSTSTTITDANLLYKGTGATTISAALVDTDVTTDAAAGVVTFSTANVRNLTANSNITVSTGLTVAGELKLANGKTINVSGTGASLTNADFKYEGGSIGYTGSTAKAFSGTASGYSLTGGTLTHMGGTANETTINGLTINSNTNLVNASSKGLLLQGGTAESPVSYGAVSSTGGYIAINNNANISATSLSLVQATAVNLWGGTFTVGDTTFTNTNGWKKFEIKHATEGANAFSMGNSAYTINGVSAGSASISTNATAISAQVSNVSLTTTAATEVADGALTNVALTAEADITLNGSQTATSVKVKEGASLISSATDGLSYTSMELESNASATLNVGAGKHVSNISGAEGSTGNALHLNMNSSSQAWNDYNTVAVSGLADVYVDSGVIATNVNKQAMSVAGQHTDLGSANLHLADGTTLLIRNGVGSTANVTTGKIYVDGEATLSLYSGLKSGDVPTISSAISSEPGKNGILTATTGGEATLTGNITLDTLKVNGSGADGKTTGITLGGTLALVNGIQLSNNGKVVINNTATFDLTDWAYTKNEDGTYSFTIISDGNATLDTANVSLNAGNVAWKRGGMTVSGTYENGVYTIGAMGKHIVNADNAFVWGTSDYYDGSSSSLDKNSVQFIGSSNVTLNGTITSADSVIDTDARVTIGGNSGSVTFTDLTNKGTIILTSSGRVSADSSFATGKEGALEINWGGDDLVKDNFVIGFTGDVVVDSGSRVGTGSSGAGNEKTVTYKSLTVNSGAQYAIDGTLNVAGGIRISGDGEGAGDSSGALKVGGWVSGNTFRTAIINADVTVVGGSASIQAHGQEGGQINGMIIGENAGSTLKFVNGDTNSSDPENSLTVQATENISTVEVGHGTLTLTGRSADAEHGVTALTGTAYNVGDSFTKTGNGKLVLESISSAAAGEEIAKVGTVNVSAGSLKITGELKAGTVNLGTGETQSTATATSESGATFKQVTLSSSAIAGATSGEGSDLKALGEISSVDLTAVASMELSNVTMYDSTIHAGGNTITYSTENGSSVVAVASTAKSNDRMAGRIAAADPEGGSATAGSLTATTVHDGGTAKGELTVDIASSLFSAENAGKTLTWTILDNVLMSEDGFSLLFGGNVKYLLDNGKDVSVELTLGDTTTTYSGTELVDNLNNFNTGSLLATDQRATLILTVENIPEPATGALSVLALAALAARRRRKSDK